jgi:hypothetical protein
MKKKGAVRGAPFMGRGALERVRFSAMKRSQAQFGRETIEPPSPRIPGCNFAGCLWPDGYFHMATPWVVATAWGWGRDLGLRYLLPAMG